MKCCATIATLLSLLVAAIASAQHWQIEQVDTSGNWTDVHFRRSPDGRLYFCYRDRPTSSVVLSTYDTSWQRQLLTSTGTGRLSFDVGPRGEVGVLCDYGIYFRRDSTWLLLQNSTLSGGILSIAGDGAPCVLGPRSFAQRSHRLVYTAWRDHGWQVDTCINSSVEWWVHTFTHESTNVPSALVGYYYRTDGRGAPPSFSALKTLKRSMGTGWRTSFVRTPDMLTPVGCDIAGRADGGAVYCWTYGAALTLDLSQLIGYTNYANARVAYDAARRSRYVAFWENGALQLWSDSSAQERVVSMSGTLAGMAIENGQPIIGFMGADSAIWLARRYASAVAEDRPTLAALRPAATFVGGFLNLPPPGGKHDEPGALLDISGRKVMDLKPGPNDVSRLAPGVYFVRQASGVEHQASGVTKVVIAR